MNRERYEEIQRRARAKIAQRKEQENAQVDEDCQLVTFDTTEALMETLSKDQ